MIRSARAVLAVGWVLLGWAAAPTGVGAQVEPGQTLSVRVTLVPSGDTFEARRRSGASITVRLYGVDVPSLDEPYGRRAHAVARRHIGGETIRVDVVARGPYGQAIGRVVGGRGGLAKRLLRRGLARHDDAGAPEAAALARLERRARRAGRGLWSEVD
jgi:endonuclease YncB( thermonuclease family)